jgi:putative DNA-invertase from lambdoid prophage Rac
MCVTMHRIYARVSTSDQNCELQLAELHRYCRDRGVEHADYVDHAFSGGRVDRPELKRLMTEAGRGDVVLVWKLDRFGRSVLHLKQMLDDLKARGIRFVATSQDVDTDDHSATGGLMMNMLACIAEFERELIRERTALGVQSAKAAGKEIGRPKRVFDRHEAARLRDAGLSLRAVSKELGVPVSTIIDALKAHVGAGEPVAQPPASEPEDAREPSAVTPDLALPARAEAYTKTPTLEMIAKGHPTEHPWAVIRLADRRNYPVTTLDAGTAAWAGNLPKEEARRLKKDAQREGVSFERMLMEARLCRTPGDWLWKWEWGELNLLQAIEGLNYHEATTVRKPSAKKPEWKYRVVWRQDDKVKRQEVNNRAEALDVCTEAMKVDMRVSVRAPISAGSTKTVAVRSIWNEAYKAFNAARTENVSAPEER